MVSMIDQNIRELIHKEIRLIFDRANVQLNESQKADGSWVTDVDQRLTDKVELILRTNFPGVNIVSEEGDHELKFPCFILDPVDGTAGLVYGTNECSLSLAFMPSPHLSDPLASGFITHLFNDFEVHSQMELPSQSVLNHGLISRSEWRKGLFQPLLQKEHRELRPMGSIALKLGLMAFGQANFVATLRPKSIWDIAAGSILLHKTNRQFCSRGVAVAELDRINWKDPMIWGTTSDAAWFLDGK
ncbi:MAG: hypothetical protein CME71_05555 [Halobacteriovorax sp.]|nr:hypothetical protein [Halobacteriovorax sp.]